jgi:Tol biopolymer transport system component
MQSLFSHRLVLLVVAVLAIGVIPVHVLADDAGVIVFESDRDGDFELYTMNGTGGGLRQLTSNTWPDHAPSLSPDGTRIAYVSQPAGVDSRPRICVMNEDGSAPVLITSDSIFAWGPSWSGDGSRIAYTRFVEGGGGEIHTMKPDGSDDRCLTLGFDLAAMDPAWSPDGSRIAFTARLGKTEEGTRIFLMNADGTVLGRLTMDPFTEDHPSWSPDGAWITYAVEMGSESGVGKVRSDGTGRTFPFLREGFNGYPSWSPDGTRLAFTATFGGNTDIYTMQPDGTGRSRLTDDTGTDRHPSWGPVAAAPAQVYGSLLFASDRDGDFEIYRVRADGTGSWAQLTSNTWDDVGPDWLDEATGRFVYASFPDGYGQLYVANADGAGRTRASNNTTDDRNPAVGPVSMDLLYVASRNDPSPSQPAYINSLRYDDDGFVSDCPPKWPVAPVGKDTTMSVSPDESKLALSRRSGPGDTAEIYVGRRGNYVDETRLTDNNCNDIQPEWSPDGTKIVFTSDRDGVWEVYVMNADGTGQTRVTTGGGYSPTWLPGGTGLFFLKQEGDRGALYTIRTDGTGERRVSPESDAIRSTDGTGYTIRDLAWSSFNGTSTPALVTVPGGIGIPRDLNADSKYEDVNGNGRKDFADVTLYFNQMSWIGANEPIAAFDYNGNGRIDFADVTWLFNNL